MAAMEKVPGAKCPTCGSKNVVRQLDGLGRVALFPASLFIKQMKCLSCRYAW